MYKVEFTPQAEEDLSLIDRAVTKRIIDKITSSLHQNKQIIIFFILVAFELLILHPFNDFENFFLIFSS